MTFQKEADFEEALIKVLADKGWENQEPNRARPHPKLGKDPV